MDKKKKKNIVKDSFWGLLGLIFRNYLIFQELKFLGLIFRINLQTFIIHSKIYFFVLLLNTVNMLPI